MDRETCSGEQVPSTLVTASAQPLHPTSQTLRGCFPCQGALLLSLPADNGTGSYSVTALEAFILHSSLSPALGHRLPVDREERQRSVQSMSPKLVGQILPSPLHRAF